MNKTALLCLSMLVFCSVEMNALATGTETWMEDIYMSRPDTRLVDVAIPGTHNSGSYDISCGSEVEPGEPFSFHFIKPVVASWAKTQFKTVYEQLVSGIRFLDFRIAWIRNQAMVVHGLVSIPFEVVLNDISRFVDEHPKEVVLMTHQLEYSYFVSLTSEEQSKQSNEVTEMVGSHFQDRLLPFNAAAKFSDFWNQHRSVMVLSQYQSFWANSYDLTQLRDYLTTNNQKKDGNQFSQLGMIFTPPEDVSFFLNPKYAFYLLLDENNLSVLSEPLMKDGPSWIQSWNRPDLGYRPNIITTDFFDRFAFVQSILSINVTSSSP